MPARLPNCNCRSPTRSTRARTFTADWALRPTRPMAAAYEADAGRVGTGQFSFRLVQMTFDNLTERSTSTPLQVIVQDRVNGRTHVIHNDLNGPPVLVQRTGLYRKIRTASVAKHSQSAHTDFEGGWIRLQHARFRIYSDARVYLRRQVALVIRRARGCNNFFVAARLKQTYDKIQDVLCQLP